MPSLQIRPWLEPPPAELRAHLSPELATSIPTEAFDSLAHDSFSVFLQLTMLWPEDEAMQWNYLRLFYLESTYFLDGIRATLHKLNSRFPRTDPELEPLTDQAVETLGGPEALMDIPPRTQIHALAEQRRLQGTMAGWALLLMYCLHRHHTHDLAGSLSLNKVWSLLARESRGIFGKAASKDQLDAAWELLKPVAHLWAARICVGEWASQPLPPGADPEHPDFETLDPAIQVSPLLRTESGEVLRHLVATAEELQRFGLSFTPKHGRKSKTLLDPDTTWILEDVPSWPIVLPEARVPPELIEKLNDSLSPRRS